MCVLPIYKVSVAAVMFPVQLLACAQKNSVDLRNDEPSYVQLMREDLTFLKTPLPPSLLVNCHADALGVPTH